MPARLLAHRGWYSWPLRALSDVAEAGEGEIATRAQSHARRRRESMR
jgi:hypothetical protein